jgi:23S rRNA pseudouridine2604 synthase
VIALFCEAVGLKVVAIRRIRIGGVSIGKVPVGQWRYLSGKEKF